MNIIRHENMTFIGIRDYGTVVPACPVLLIFASQDSYNVYEVAQKNNGKDMVSVNILSGYHGFTDKYGRSFNEESKIKAFKMADDFIGRLESTTAV